jgi:hypothetical protein
MVTVKTQSGIELETLPTQRDRRMEAAAVAACLALLAVIAAGALAAACLRGCAAEPATAAALYEQLWSRGIYGDELADWGQ